MTEEERRKRLQDIYASGKYKRGPTPKNKKGKYTTTSAREFYTPEGKRWYKGEGTSYDKQSTRTLAFSDAQSRAENFPADSLRSEGGLPIFPKIEKKKKKKKKFWER